MSMPMTPEEQPMPDRLCDSTSVRILKWFTTMDASEGVGAKQEQMTIRMSICSHAVTSQEQQRLLMPPSGDAKTQHSMHSGQDLLAYASPPAWRMHPFYGADAYASASQALMLLRCKSELVL